ncbi:MAG TPA: hypothetical protein VNQ90_19205 [Chthoniobacteraceae bacterium]|nr:hypothetical protein [Chthoniobacteraceae bacterium]
MRNAALFTAAAFLLTAPLPPGVAKEPAPTGSAAEPGDAEVAARSEALEVAGAFSNDGFKIRDGHWVDGIAVNKPKIIQVNLFAGNQYWFIAAASEKAKKIAVSIFNEKGEPLLSEPYSNARQSAAGFAPETSGPYYVQVEETEGEPATFCFLYSYK